MNGMYVNGLIFLFAAKFSGLKVRGSSQCLGSRCKDHWEIRILVSGKDDLGRSTVIGCQRPADDNTGL